MRPFSQFSASKSEYWRVVYTHYVWISIMGWMTTPHIHTKQKTSFDHGNLGWVVGRCWPPSSKDDWGRVKTDKSTHCRKDLGYEVRPGFYLWIPKRFGPNGQRSVCGHTNKPLRGEAKGGLRTEQAAKDDVGSLIFCYTQGYSLTNYFFGAGYLL